MFFSVVVDICEVWPGQGRKRGPPSQNTARQSKAKDVQTEKYELSSQQKVLESLTKLTQEQNQERLAWILARYKLKAQKETKRLGHMQSDSPCTWDSRQALRFVNPTQDSRQRTHYCTTLTEQSEHKPTGSCRQNPLLRRDWGRDVCMMSPTDGKTQTTSVASQACARLRQSPESESTMPGEGCTQWSPLTCSGTVTLESLPDFVCRCCRGTAGFLHCAAAAIKPPSLGTALWTITGGGIPSSVAPVPSNCSALHKWAWSWARLHFLIEAAFLYLCLPLILRGIFFFFNLANAMVHSHFRF